MYPQQILDGRNIHWKRSSEAWTTTNHGTAQQSAENFHKSEKKQVNPQLSYRGQLLVSDPSMQIIQNDNHCFHKLPSDQPRSTKNIKERVSLLSQRLMSGSNLREFQNQKEYLSRGKLTASTARSSRAVLQSQKTLSAINMKKAHTEEKQIESVNKSLIPRKNTDQQISQKSLSIRNRINIRSSLEDQVRFSNPDLAVVMPITPKKQKVLNSLLQSQELTASPPLL